MMNTIKISVISPIYKVEKFIGKAVETMMSQTLNDVEFIFVDDCSPDRSVAILEEVLEKYPERKPYVKIIHHERNLGLPAARNSGLAIAEGEYIFHWDSDDYADNGMLESMYDFAISINADIVWTDWFLTFAKNERRMTQPDYKSPYEALKGMLGGAMKYNVWNKLVRRSLYTENAIAFPAGFGMGEDMTMILLFAHAKNAAHLPKAFYHYVRTNTAAFSNGVNPEHFKPLKRNVEWINGELQSIYGSELDAEIAFLKLESKYPLLVTTADWKFYRLWNDWFPEANVYISQNKNVSLRSRIVQQCAVHKCYLAVWLHYLLVCKFIYGILYR